jgi:hypothetical protein
MGGGGGAGTSNNAGPGRVPAAAAWSSSATADRLGTSHVSRERAMPLQRPGRRGGGGGGGSVMIYSASGVLTGSP